MKSNKLRKIISITIISLVLALTVAVIVLALVPKRHYDPISKDFYMVSVFREKTSGAFQVKETANSDEQQDTIDKLMELYEKSLKASVLSSMFQGTSKFEPNVMAKDQNISGKYNTSSVLALEFWYKETQTLCVNGKEYKYQSVNQTTKTVTYNRAVLILTNTESFEKATLYLIDGDESETTSKFQVEFLAHQSELYDYVIDMDNLIGQE